MSEKVGTPKTKDSDKFFKDGYAITKDEVKTDKRGNKEGTFGYIFANGNRHQRRKARKELELRIRRDLINNKKKYERKEADAK